MLSMHLDALRFQEFGNKLGNSWSMIVILFYFLSYWWKISKSSIEIFLGQLLKVEIFL